MSFWRGLIAGSLLGVGAALFMAPESRATSRRRLADVALESVRGGARRLWKGLRGRLIRAVVR